LPSNVNGIYTLNFEKGQAGASDYALSLFAETSQNPVIPFATGIALMFYPVPSLPTLPPSSTVLKALWPRLKNYVFLDPTDPLYLICQAGAEGDESQAKSCNDIWLNQRVPTLLAQMRIANTTLWEEFSNVDSNGIPFSGSYFHESDYFQPEWRQSYWGDINYVRLYEIKQKYDPKGLFICHHCVGSEDWDETGTCRIKGGEVKKDTYKVE